MGLEFQAHGVLEDAVVGHERHAEAQRSGRYPAVGVAVAWAERMAHALAGDAQLGVGADEVGPGVDDLGAGGEAAHASAARVPEESAVAQVGGGLER